MVNIILKTNIYGRRYINAWSSDDPFRTEEEIFEIGSEAVLGMFQHGINKFGLAYKVQKATKLSNYSKLFKIFSDKGNRIAFGTIERVDSLEEGFKNIE